MDTQKLKKPSHLQEHLKRLRRNKNKASSKSRTYFKRWQGFNPIYWLPWNFSCLKIQVFCVYLCLLFYDYLIFTSKYEQKVFYHLLYVSWQFWTGEHPGSYYKLTKSIIFPWRSCWVSKHCAHASANILGNIFLVTKWMFWWNTHEVDLFVCRPYLKNMVRRRALPLIKKDR
jgi:hypothetical protein